MNPTKAAAIVALIVTLGAGAYLAYELTVIAPEQENEASICAHCTQARQAAAANWAKIQTHVQRLEAEGLDIAAVEYERQHLGERPVTLGPCSGCDFSSLDYKTPSAIAIIGLITSLVLFGAAQRTN
jgi:hypothetical protein